jgi:hypothetical protein
LIEAFKLDKGDGGGGIFGSPEFSGEESLAASPGGFFG